jgi:NADH dehydrogenase (ubiquinone) 1 alpha subcomplex subunit 5
MHRSLPRLFAAASSPKTSTGVVGLPVVPNAVPILKALYKRILSDVSVISVTSPYRVDVEAVTKHRLSVLEQEADINAVEEMIGAGQVEELIEQAEDELALIPEMAEWKPWEDEPGREIPLYIQH